jgi:hypothetical protein
MSKQDMVIWQGYVHPYVVLSFGRAVLFVYDNLQVMSNMHW